MYRRPNPRGRRQREARKYFKLKQRPNKRRSELIRILSEMSRDWSLYTAADWLPLEAELELTDPLEN